MRRLRPVLAILVLVLLAAASARGQSRATVAIGHAGPVRALAARDDLGYAFSSGADGSLIVWDLEHEARYASWQIGPHPLGLIAAHPTETVVAVYESTTLASGTIIVLDWVSGERLYSVAVEGRPAFLEYSPRGTYLMAATQSFESVRVIEAQTGRDTGYLSNGFGVVSFIQVAPSEQNVMTYVPSRGEFIYWALRSGRELQTVRTATRLTHLTLIDRENFRFVAAGSDDGLVIVDNLTGSTGSTYPLSRIDDISYDAERDRILVLSQTRGESSVLAFEFRSGRLRRARFTPQSIHEDTLHFAATGARQTRTYIAGAQDGEVALYDDRTGQRTVIGRRMESRIHDVAWKPGSLHLAVGDRVLAIESDLFAERSGPLAVSEIDSEWSELGGRPALASHDGEVIAWNTGEPGVARILGSTSEEPLYADEDAVPIASANGFSSGILFLHRDGRIVELRDGIARLAYTGRGIQDALVAGSLGLVTAKSRVSAFDSSVIIVNERTGETVAAATDAFLTTRLAFDEENGELYALGLFGDQNDAETRLVRLEGRALRSSRTLATAEGEVANADIVWDAGSRSLLATLEPGSVQRFVNGRPRALEEIERLPVRLETNGRLVFATNADGTATVWELASGRHLADIYVQGDSWIAITKTGAYWTSSRSIESILAFRPAPGSTLTLRDFRISLPVDAGR